MSRINGHEERINRALAVAFQREGRSAVTMESPMSLAEVTEEGGEGDEIIRAKMEAVAGMLYFIFQDGPHPGCTLRLLYLMAQRIKPELLLHMSGAELADMLGETRAAWSARNKRVFTGYQQARGLRAARGVFQNSESAAAQYALAARGNKNRRGKRAA